MEKMTLLARLEKMFPGAKKTTLRDMVAAKRVRLHGQAIKSVKQMIEPEEKLEVVDAATDPDATPLREGLRLLHFDADIIVVEKPAGLLTATDAEERRPTAWRILAEFFRRQNHKNRVQLVHRLDRDASGLLVFARTRDAFSFLKSQFFEHTITRQYELIVHGIPTPPGGRAEHLLIENDQGIVHITPDAKKGKLAILDYETLEKNKSKRLSRLRCTLFTGRKHQIRVQMKALGHAICGDPVYGTADEPPGRLALHAAFLALTHPRTGKRVEFHSPAPASFAHLIQP
ncbi:MAG TPA: RluA family pseudouridine synthase [Phycisphaerae bacterium]|nr:RluA family pseudouridine synthase [Phycisphaerae bacterium]